MCRCCSTVLHAEDAKTLSVTLRLVAGHFSVKCITAEHSYRVEKHLIGLCTADEYKGSVGSQVLNYSSPGMLQIKERCGLNFKNVLRIDSEIHGYSRL